MNTDLHFSSERQDWATPWAFFRALDAEFGFQTDVCATAANAKCARFFTPEMDAFKQEWSGVCWLNPPYGREIGKWIKRAYDSACEGSATVVCLLPARTDTKWFHDICVRGEVRLLRGRLKFDGHSASAPFPSMLVIFYAHLDPGGTIRVAEAAR